MADTTFVGSQIFVQKAGLPNAADLTIATPWNTSTLQNAFKEIKNVQDIGELGDTHTPIEYNVLGESRVKRLPGSVDGGVVPVSVIFDSTDDAATNGQGIVRLANGTDGEHLFRVRDVVTETPAAGLSYYFVGTVADRRWATRDNATVKMFTFNIYVNSTLYGGFADPSG